MKLKFIEYLKFCIAHDLEFNAVIGDVDMPCTFCFSDDMEFTDYCMEKYGDLLNSMCEVRFDLSGRTTDVVTVDYDDDVQGERFAWALAGYIADSEYQKLFNC